MQPLTGAATLKEKWPKRLRPVRTAWPTSRSAPRRPTPVTTCNFPGPRRQLAEANLHDLLEPLESHAVALYRGGLAVHPSSSSPVYPSSVPTGRSKRCSRPPTRDSDPAVLRRRTTLPDDGGEPDKGRVRGPP